MTILLLPDLSNDFDATNSFDPDVGDNIQYVWKQISGNKVEIMPNPFLEKLVLRQRQVSIHLS